MGHHPIGPTIHAEITVIVIYCPFNVEPQRLNNFSIVMTSKPTVCTHPQFPFIIPFTIEFPYGHLPCPYHIFILIQRPQKIENPLNIIRLQVQTVQQLQHAEPLRPLGISGFHGFFHQLHAFKIIVSHEHGVNTHQEKDIGVAMGKSESTNLATSSGLATRLGSSSALVMFNRVNTVFSWSSRT